MIGTSVWKVLNILSPKLHPTCSVVPATSSCARRPMSSKADREVRRTSSLSGLGRRGRDGEKY